MVKKRQYPVSSRLGKTDSSGQYLLFDQGNI